MKALSRPAEELAPRLIGCRLVRVLEDGTRLSGRIVEVEAYLGEHDRACHTFGGRRTPRTEAMYARGGLAYVYFTYGMHWCFNVVCGKVGEGTAVLVRAILPEEGVERMRANRGTVGRRERAERLCAGPARLCQALVIDGGLNLEDLVQGNRLFLEAGARVPEADLERGARIGVEQAGAWARTPLRWWLRGHPSVSRVPRE